MSWKIGSLRLGAQTVGMLRADFSRRVLPNSVQVLRNN